MVDTKLFSLDFIDNVFKALNLRSCDGDRPSTVSGVSLPLNDSNLHQHGKMVQVTSFHQFLNYYFYSNFNTEYIWYDTKLLLYSLSISVYTCTYSNADVDICSFSSLSYWAFNSRR